MGQGMSNLPTVHAESARVGIRLACIAMQGKAPPEDVVNRLIQSGITQVTFEEFPLDVLKVVKRERHDVRRTFAIRAMEVLLHHAGDSSMLTNDELDKIVSKAWHMAAAMEREDSTAQQLSTLGRSE
jgi:hypothetical protein